MEASVGYWKRWKYLSQLAKEDDGGGILGFGDRGFAPGREL